MDFFGEGLSNMIALESDRYDAQVPARDRVIVLMLEGELSDREVAQVSAELFRLAHQGHRYLVMDFTDVSHLDYRGVRPLVARAEVFRKAGGDIKLAGLSPYLAAIFRAAGAAQAFEVHPGVVEARKSFGQRLSAD